ncbi:Iron/ascorbate family oxidoreductase [Handroanthus impetiginosus]|uniref:Iron/ascorbate family oxidoreductase n=1 Tax=Handroanthus impetiginosus TaxID=429701 RepID=A0A2G9HSV0_9LAMI|nr:Iron/ascorbate family oxidoreductase [Handroanthus impetiginosus]
MVNSSEARGQQVPAPAEISVLNCIDLSSPDIQSSVSLLKQACLDSGFFYVINHGIEEEFMDEVFSQSKRFFSLPMEEKMKLLRNEKNRGYTPMFDESLDPSNQIHGDYKEGYYIGVEISEADADTQKPFYGPNEWPSEVKRHKGPEKHKCHSRLTEDENFPCHYSRILILDFMPGWRETMEKYHQKALEVARAVSRLIALALDLNFDFFDQPEILGKPIAILRLLHYEDRTSEPEKGIFGAGAHSDFGLITLLATDDIFGLQICKDRHANPQIWEYVPPLKGAFIVNLGDMLERWSNCIFRSTLHRVLGNGQERYSIAYFLEPNHDCVVECLPTCQSEKSPPKYPPIKCQDYLLQRYKDTHSDLNSYKG